MLNEFMQSVKDYLVRLGPNSVFVQAALRMHGLRHGYSVEFANDAITLHKAEREMILNKAQYVQVPIMMECYDLYFDTSKARLLKVEQSWTSPGPVSNATARVALHFIFRQFLKTM